MKIAIIGRSELLYECAVKALELGYKIPLIITSKEAPEYRRTSKDFEKLANEIHAKYIYSSKINDVQIMSEIRDCGPIDIGVSINYSGIISQKIIDFFKLGILNAHGGDLPRYRGNACQAWAILNREKRIALCIHKMKGDELDSGDIIEREYFDVDMDTKIGRIYQWMQEIIPALMIEAVKKIISNNEYVLEVQSKDPKDALRCYPRIPEDGKINWAKDGEDIIRLINASSEPFSGAFCFFESKRMIIWKARLVNDVENYLAMPGQVSKIDLYDQSIEVITGAGKIAIKDIEYEGARMPPSKIVRSIRSRLT